MPKINKQTARKKAPTRRKQSGGIADRIQSISDVPVNGLKFSIYGRSGTGKTRFACTFPKPLLLIGAENGTRSVRNVKGVDFVPITSSPELAEIVELLKEGHYKSAVLDTASALQGCIVKEFLGLDELPTQFSWGMTDQRGWGAIGVQTKERLRSLLDLADTHGINSLVIAQERNFSDDGDSGGVLLPTIGSALTPSVTGWLNPACDYVCQTFIREGYDIKKTKVGKVVKEQHINNGKIEYCLRTMPDSVYTVKFRVVSGVTLPDVVVDPTYDKISKLLVG